MRAYKSNLSAFDDSLEVADGLSGEADIWYENDLGYPYWIKEAEVHIIGLWKEAKRMERRIKQMQKRLDAHEA
jgi:hypothetical protein